MFLRCVHAGMLISDHRPNCIEFGVDLIRRDPVRMKHRMSVGALRNVAAGEVDLEPAIGHRMGMRHPYRMASVCVHNFPAGLQLLATRYWSRDRRPHLIRRRYRFRRRRPLL